MEQALELMPEIVGDESVGVKYAINGLLSVTADGLPLLGETPEVRGLWSRGRGVDQGGPGRRQDGRRADAPRRLRDRRPRLRHRPHARASRRPRAHVRARASEGFNKMYGIVHPAEQWESDRDVRLSPFHARERELGAVFYQVAGWERPHWYASNEPLLEEYGDRVTRRESEWESRWWSPIINAEHLALRERAAMIDLSAFAIFDIDRPGRARRRPAARAAPDGRRRRPRRLHAAADAGRRLPLGPHDHAPRRASCSAS